MSCITSTQRAIIQARLDKKEAQLSALNDAYDESIENFGIKSFKFDSGEGSQSTTFRGPEEISREINRLETEINRLRRRLSGTGIVNLNLRRRSYVR